MAAVKHPAPRRYGGQTGDERIAERRAALVTAAFDLVAEHGWRDLKIDPLCRRAGLNKRYFYETFGDLEAVIAALTSALADDAITVTLAAIADGVTPAEAIRSGVSAFVAHLTDDPRRARVLFGAVPAGDAAAGHRAAAIRRVITTVAAEGRSRKEIVDTAAAALGAAVLVGGTSQAVLDWLDGEIACDRAQLVAQLIATWEAIGDAVPAQVA